MKSHVTLSLILSVCLIVVGGLVFTSATGLKDFKPASIPRSAKLAASSKSKRAISITQARTPETVPGQSATLLSDGRWLLVGGESTNGPLSAAFIKDSRTGEVTSLRNGLRQARAWHSATMLPDGNILILGGVGADGSIVSAVELFNPETQQFEILTSSGLTPRAFHTATLLTEGKVLLAGGVSGKGSSPAKAELWNPQTKTASPLVARLQAARQKHHAALLPDGNVLLWGGVDRDGSKVEGGEIYDSLAQSFNWSGAFSVQDDGSAPFLAASLPESGSMDVPLDSRIALRLSKPLKAETVNSGTIALSGPQGEVAAKVVLAENGSLLFITPVERLLPDSNYNLSVNGPTDNNNLPLSSTVITFKTVNNREQDNPSVAQYDDEDWRPDADNLRGNWRSKRTDSEAQSLPPLQAEQGVTALAGQVLALNGKPLANTTLQIGDKTTRTDETGRFLLSSLPQGHQVLKIDGRTANRPGKTYGIFRVGVNITEGKTNVLDFTIWMPKLDMAHAVRIPAPTKTEVTITNPLIPGLELRLPPQTVIRDLDGQTVTQLSITPIPTNQSPFPLPAGINVPVFFTIQPGGSRIIPPRARLIYPNFTNERPGARIDFWNYDPEGKGWYIYGQGTVSADGRQIIPDAGVVLYEFTGAMVSQTSNAPQKGPVICGACGADPVDLYTGLFVYNKTDLALPGIVPITLTRTYRPQDTVSRPFGIGTSHPYEMFLIGDYRPWTYIELILPDGARVHYDRISPGTEFADAVYEHTATPTVFYKSKISYNPQGWWDLTLKDGTVYEFPDSEAAPLPRQAALIGMRDRYGNALVLTRDANHNLTRISSPSGRWIEFTYDASNRITQAKDNIGRTVGYEYDAGGRLSKVTDVNGGVTEYTYDASNRMLTIKDPKGILYLTNEYDADGRVTKQTQADNSTYQFSYTVTSGTGTVTQTEVTDPLGNVRRVTFNSSGYKTAEVFAVGTTEQQTVSYERQIGTNLLLSVTDALSRKTSYVYDSMGNVTGVTRMVGTAAEATTSFTYDSRFNQVASVTDPLQHTTSFTYDDKGNLQSVSDALNHQATFAYNGAGQLVSATDPLSHTTQFGYEGGDLVSVTDPKGNVSSRFIDSAGRVGSVTDPLGRVTLYEYDSFNQLKKITDALGGVTSFSYDANGNLLSVTDARGKITGYTYDNMDRVATLTDQLQGPASVESYEYDAAGNLKKYTDRRGKVTSFGYDHLNRLTFSGFGTVVNGGTTTYESTISYSFDAGNRLTQAVDSSSGTIARSYNDLALTFSETTALGVISYGFDKAGRLTGKTIAGQAAISYAYDNANRLTGITQGTSGVGFTYDAANRGTSLTLPNGVVMEYAYDEASRLTGITYEKGTTVLGDLTYEYDAAGRRTRTDGSFARTLLPQALASSSYNDANRLTQRGTTNLTYDNSGNLTSDGTNSYTWDARNQLTSISGAVTASFQYDAFGRRISKTVNGQTTQYLYDGMDAVQEVAASTASANMLNGGLDQLFTRTDSNGTWNALRDGLGSTIALTDSNGAVQTEYSYEPFGNSASSGAANNNPSQYTGRENDGTGLYYYRARYYSPTLQRFISEDPIGLAGGINFYAYVGNNPLGFVDPYGLDKKTGGLTASEWFDDNYWAAYYTAFTYYSNPPDPHLAKMGLSGGLSGPPIKDLPLALANKFGAPPKAYGGTLSLVGFAGPVAPPPPTTTFLGQENGPSIIVPNGATGPGPTNTGKGFSYTGGSGGPGLDPKVTGVRIMDPTKPNVKYPYPNGYAAYMNTQGQTVDPCTGQTVPFTDPSAHIPLR